MTPLELLQNRTSCKSYKPDVPAAEDLKTILEAGRNAPSGMNRQPLAFLPVSSKEVRNQLSKLNADILGTDTDPFYGAPAVIAVLADPAISTYVYDGSLAMGQLLLAANALGYGSCWIHRAKEVFQTTEGKAILQKAGLSTEYEGIGFCIIGKPDKEGVRKPRTSLTGEWI